MSNRYGHMDACPMCGGSGAVFMGLWLPCPECGGTGEIENEEEDNNG